MSGTALLQEAAGYFKMHYPGLTPEAVIAFILVTDIHQPTVQAVASSLGMDEGQLGAHLASLMEVGGAGLLALQPVLGGGNRILMTPRGEQVKNDMQMTLAG